MIDEATRQEVAQSIDFIVANIKRDGSTRKHATIEAVDGAMMYIHLKRIQLSEQEKVWLRQRVMQALITHYGPPPSEEQPNDPSH